MNSDVTYQQYYNALLLGVSREKGEQVHDNSRDPVVYVLEWW